MFIIGLMFVYGKFSTVITVQTIFCCNPNEAVPVLIYLINQTTESSLSVVNNLGDCPLHNKENNNNRKVNTFFIVIDRCLLYKEN